MNLITYQVSTTYFFRETGQKVQAGDTVNLPRGAAERYKTSHPGLLKEARVMEVAHPDAVRSAEPVAPAAPETSVETPVETPAPAEEPKKKRGKK